ncbi:MAG: ribokinase [Erysipelotrichaceae bacterium]
MSRIVVVGSINVDLITIASRFPQKGETVVGLDFKVLPGGKGANQAVCAAKLGSEVVMIGCVGDDVNGKSMVENLRQNGVQTHCIETIEGVPTGCAQITIAEQDNSIVIVPGANAHVSPKYVEANARELLAADVVLVQLEIPMETIEWVVEFCAQNKITVILNPAPAQKLSKELVEKVSFITPNEIELSQIYGSTKEAVLQSHPNQVVMTAGSDGVYFHDGLQLVHLPIHKVEVVDTTGAGDSFNGALAVALANHKTLAQAIAFGNKAGSVTVQKLGAQSAMPTQREMEEWIW